MADIGLRRGNVKLVPHSPKWIVLYKKESSFLSKILHKYILEIEHIGSTSIPNIQAKPIIDIAIAVEDLSELSDIIEIMEVNGYFYRGEQGIVDRHLFVKGSDKIRTHHIHLMPITHYQWRTHILFRDYLKLHPDAADEYSKLKLELQKKYPTNRDLYLEGKAEFIENIIKIAKMEEKKKL